jgi:ketosteroid isomerase-like protein
MTNSNSASACATDLKNAPNSQESDRDQIVHHINGLFQAFIRKDLDAIQRGHTSDWKGFQVKSRSLVRGIDQYMEAAKQALSTFDGTRYELLDIDIQIHGDVAIVFYLARYWFKSANSEQSILLRSVDIYRRETAGWNQSGSNICTIPDES